MSTNLEFSPVEQASIQVVMQRRGERIKNPYTLERHLESWQSGIAQIEDGFRGGIDDYIFYLHNREQFDQLLAELPEAIQRKIGLLLKPLDARFKRATTYDRLGKLSRYVKLPNDKWWWRRLPRELGTLQVYWPK